MHTLRSWISNRVCLMEKVMQPPSKQEQQEKDPDDAEDSDNDEFSKCVTSIWKDQVEIGLHIVNPLLQTKCLELSTRLSPNEMAPLFDGTQWAGTRVWRAAWLTTHHVAQQLEQSYDVLMELGCGLGVPGMLLKQWADHHRQKEQQQLQVLLTDRPSLLEQLQCNLQQNFPTNNKSIQAYPLDWSTEGVEQLVQDHPNLFSKDSCKRISLNCDCVYEPLYGKDAWLSLCDTLVALTTVGHVSMHIISVERRTADGVGDFLEHLHHQACIDRIDLVLRNDDDPHHVIEIYKAICR